MPYKVTFNPADPDHDPKVETVLATDYKKKGKHFIFINRSHPARPQKVLSVRAKYIDRIDELPPQELS
jgi:hypothetical protein